MRTVLFCLILFPLFSSAQSERGTLSLGVRSTLSAFDGHAGQSPGLGVGGQFRVQLANRVNTEWFMDYITSEVYGLAERQDVHIGWSMMYYLVDTKNFSRPVTPYVLAGHCFDLTRLVDYSEILCPAQRWSAAVQAGIGTHINISPIFDISTTIQYMLHIGNSLEAHVSDTHDHSHEPGVVEHPQGLSFEEHKHGSAEGHLLVNISLNFKVSGLWQKHY